MAKRILFLDDNPIRTNKFRLWANPSATVVAVETVPDTIKAISKKGPFDVIFLDHDLGGEVYVAVDRTDNGSEVVRWIASNMGKFKKPLPLMVVHSLNYNAAMGMARALEDSGFKVKHLPFCNPVFKELVQTATT